MQEPILPVTVLNRFQSLFSLLCCQSGGWSVTLLQCSFREALMLAKLDQMNTKIIQCIQKAFTALHFFNILSCYNLIPNCIQLILHTNSHHDNVGCHIYSLKALCNTLLLPIFWHVCLSGLFSHSMISTVYATVWSQLAEHHFVNMQKERKRRPSACCCQRIFTVGEKWVELLCPVSSSNQEF